MTQVYFTDDFSAFHFWTNEGCELGEKYALLASFAEYTCLVFSNEVAKRFKRELFGVLDKLNKPEYSKEAVIFSAIPRSQWRNYR